ncbi:hypothetical protein C8R42DRAFT_644985 [Lentinula raphanica]|nr:hypothetical protein C8R42DRAFT_644985 [Lentinula raphanica]
MASPSFPTDSDFQLTIPDTTATGDPTMINNSSTMDNTTMDDTISEILAMNEPPMSGIVSVSASMASVPASISGPETFGPAFWLRNLQGVAYCDGIWTFINVDLGNNTISDSDMMDCVHYSFAKGKGWDVPKPSPYDFISTHVNKQLNENTRCFWTFLTDNGKLFRAPKPVGYLCIWTKGELLQMNINYFKLRDNAGARYPKPAKALNPPNPPSTQHDNRPTGMKGVFASFEFSEREAKTVMSSLIHSAERGNSNRNHGEHRRNSRRSRGRGRGGPFPRSTRESDRALVADYVRNAKAGSSKTIGDFM